MDHSARRNGIRSLLVAGLLAVAGPAAAEPADSDGVNDANNPLTQKSTILLQNYWQPILNGQPSRGADQLLVRGVLPHDALGVPQLFRATLPVAMTYGPDGATAGLGDATIFDLPMFFIDKVKIGVGPLVVVPTSTSRALGAGKWQAGGQMVVSAAHPWGLTAGFVSYQQSFENSLQTITAQPLLFYNLPDGYYLRSSGIATFNLGARTSVLPVGLGLGRVFDRPDGTVVNVYLEPQYSVLQTGRGVPSFQVLLGFNIQFPRGAR